MKSIVSTSKKFRAILTSAAIGIIILLALFSFIQSEARMNQQNRLMKVTQSYYNFDNHLQSFISNHVNLLKGFSAYIQTYEQYEEQVVYAYLGHLLTTDMEFIRNTGILKDTTIVWNYPTKENASSIGVDLAKIPSQRASILRIKKTLTYSFDGPVTLVQGGMGYILRIPILKNGAYWGLASVVLKVDKVKALFDAYADEHELKVLILRNTSQNPVVYGDKEILKQNPVMFKSSFRGEAWSIYVLPKSDAETRSTGVLVLIAGMGIFVALWVSSKVYRLFVERDEISSKNDTLNAIAMKDHLTGIYNRNYIDVRLQDETERVNRLKGSLSVIFFDLDHFKRVNDVFGHNHGDMVLKNTVEVVTENIRVCDTFGRWGGEEFVILMPGTPLKGAVANAEKIRRAIEAHEHLTVGQVTASFGVAEYVMDEFIGSWFNRVDKMLYEAKNSGRNCVKVYETTEQDALVQVKVRWHEEWKSKNEALNADHRRIVELGNVIIEDAYNYSQKRDLHEHAEAFVESIRNHFQREEDILKTINYPELVEHAAMHIALVEGAIALTNKLRRNELSIQELLDFLQQKMVVEHLTQEDNKYFPYLKR